MPHEALHRVSVETDQIGQGLFAEHGHAARFLFQNDLQQDAAGDVFAALGILDDEGLDSITSCLISASVT